MKHKILLFGGNGQIGKSFQRQILPDDWNLGIFTRAECDFTQPASIAKAIRDFAPDIVINAAAMTNVDACETDIQNATEVNFHAVANIASQCATIDAPLIQISTDYVFDGQDGQKPYLPDDQMNPLNIYGQTKMMGEEAARHAIHWHVIARTSLVFSSFGNNILTRILHQINTQEEVQAATDQVCNPASAHFVARTLIKIADDILRGKANGFGTFHICGEPAVSRFEFLQAIMEAYAPFTTKRPTLVPIKIASQADRVPRPLFSVMNTDKVRDVYGIQPHLWRDDLAPVIKDISLLF